MLSVSSVPVRWVVPLCTPGGASSGVWKDGGGHQQNWEKMFRKIYKLQLDIENMFPLKHLRVVVRPADNMLQLKLNKKVSKLLPAKKLSLQMEID